MSQRTRILTGDTPTGRLHLGHLVEEGPTEMIFNNPKDQRTQDYITGRFG